ncbi:MAG: hypothetical protein L0Z50_17615 [Verrucomicrobiales bacterium]|nr:hypothetical protein [Verrucomicrobiales bacterium]
MTFEIKIRAPIAPAVLQPERPYLAELLPGNDLVFAAPRIMGDVAHYVLRVFPGALIDGRIVGTDGQSHQFIAAVVTPNPSSSDPAERRGLVVLSSATLDALENLYAEGWRVRRSCERRKGVFSDHGLLRRDLGAHWINDGRYLLLEIAGQRRIMHQSLMDETLSSSVADSVEVHAVEVTTDLAAAVSQKIKTCRTEEFSVRSMGLRLEGEKAA